VSDGALGGAIAERDVDKAHGLERGQRFGGGEIETRSLEFLFDRTMEQECQRGDEDMRLRPVVCMVIDRPHVDDVLEAGEGTLHIRQLLVQPHGIDRGQVGLFSLNDVLAFVSLLARKVDGMLEEAEGTVLVGPVAGALGISPEASRILPVASTVLFKGAACNRIAAGEQLVT
jgi:hypothetical protein